MDAAATAGGGWRRRGKGVKAVAAAGGLSLNELVVLRIFGEKSPRPGFIGEVTPHRLATTTIHKYLSSQDLWLYDTKFVCTLGHGKGVGYRI